MSARNWLFSLLCGGVFVVAGAIAGHAADDTTAPAPKPAVASDQTAAAPADEPEYASRGADACLRCHDKGAPLNMLKTEHSMKGDARTPFAQHACESCHGASPDHMNKPPVNGKRVSPAVVFNGPNKSPAEVIDKVCMTCHQNNLRMYWQGSQHDSNQVACTDCHTLHTTKDPVRQKMEQAETCFKCHSDRRADSYKRSHHPVREGKVICSDCHNPHGTAGEYLLKEDTVNETCYLCHAEKRGPMMWEHQPVREDCTICHNPHGSSNDRLLKQRLPSLCADCHANPGLGGSGNFIGGGSLANPSTNTTESHPQQARQCLYCHSQIHGSNSPGGAYFFR